MASNYTEHYGLCQWAPEDKFLREEFNGDNEKVEAAVRAAKTQAEEASSALEPLTYNVSNLLLQNYYDSKHTGFKKAVVFDGFMDSSQVSSVTTALRVDTAKRWLHLDNQGQSDFSHNAGSTYYCQIDRNSTMSHTFTATGNGTLTAVEISMRAIITCSIYHNETLLGASTMTNASESLSFTSYPFSIPVQAGESYLIVLASGGNASAWVAYRERLNGSFNHFGYTLCFTPLKASSGVMLARSISLGAAFRRALAWVRHDYGTVDLALNSGRGWSTLPCVATRSVANLAGQACTERAYALDLDGGPTLQVRLTLNTSGYTQMRVYDYGVTVL